MSTLQVIIPAYNAASYIAQTIDSVLAQQCDGVEVIVLDNASTDATPQIVASYADRQVKHIRNAENIGSCGNHNLALRIATADYIKLLSADDVLLPGVLAKQKALLDAHPNVGLVTCDCIVTDDELRPLGATQYLRGVMNGRKAVEIAARRMMNVIGAPSNVMLRRTAVKSLAYDPSLKWLGDLDFACRLLKDWDFGNIDEPGFMYRRHDSSDTAVTCSYSIRMRDELLFVGRFGGGMTARLRVLYRHTRRRLSQRAAP